MEKQFVRAQEPRFPFGGVDPEVIENVYLGSLVEATLEAAHGARAGKGYALPDPDEFFDRPIRDALGNLARELGEHYAQGADLWHSLGG